MTLAELQNSLRLWEKRKKYRFAKWQKYVKATRKLPDGPERDRLWALRVKWNESFMEANSMVKRRRAQIAGLATKKMSGKGLAMLIREEGHIPYAYNDPVGHATFGVGHLIHKGNVTSADRQKWGTKNSPKSRAFVLEVLRDDIIKYENAVLGAIGDRKLKPHQFDACVSLCFNIGTGGFATSTVAKKIRAGDFRGAADAFLLWDNPPMLRPRRERERRLFMTGEYA